MNARLASADDKDALPSDGSGLLLGVIGGKYGCGRALFICRVVHAAGLAAIFDLVRDINAAIDARQIGRDDGDAARRALDDFDCVLGVVTLRRSEDAQPPVPVDEIERLIEERKAARGRRDFAAADGIRNALAERGILLEDNPGGTRWKRK